MTVKFTMRSATVIVWTALLISQSRGDANFLFVSNGTDVLKIDRETKTFESLYHQDGGRIVGLTADIDDGILFWSDVSPKYRAIYRTWLDTSSIQIVLQGVLECHGLSVDWVSNHIYWTDSGRQTVEVANYDGTGRRILIGYNLKIPRGIIVDPVFGYIFWADQGTKRIERAGLEGSDRRVLVDKEVHWPNQLAISYPTRRLYWVDAKKKKIASCDIDGDDIVTERELSNTVTAFGLVVIGNNAFISTWSNAKILSTIVSTGKPLWTEELNLPDSTELFSLVSTALTLQPRGSHPCSIDKGGCTHLCLPTRKMFYRCACPSYGGLALSRSARSCEAPSELLFFTLKESGDVGFISLNGAQSHDLTLAGRSTHPSAVTYDPIEQVVYWSDVTEQVIYRASLASGEREVFLNSSDGIDVVDGLALDWVARQLYFTNMGSSKPGLDGAIYTWHRIEMVSLHRAERKTVVTDVDRPRSLDLDIENGFLFYGDWGRHPKIVQALLDGSNSQIILDTGLSNPNGLTFYAGQLFVADSNYDNHTSSPHLKVYDLARKQWQDLKLSTNISLPMGLAVSGHTLYYSDWISTEMGAVGFIKSYDLRFGVDNNVILQGYNPTSLHYSPLARKRQDSVDGFCDKTPCSHTCVRVPSNTDATYNCLCPDESAKILSSNNITCDRPENFLLYADLNTIQLVSLDEDTEATPQFLLFDHIDSNFVALAYDVSTDTIYWSDLTRKRIYGSPFNDIGPNEIYSGDLYIEGMSVDADRQRLYWTGYNSSGHGIIGRISLQQYAHSHHTVVKNLHNPRAVHLQNEKKLLFWTEYGDKLHPPSVHRAKITGKKARRLMHTGLFWPNALATQGEELYVGDGAGKVFVMDLQGSKVRELSFLKGSMSHVYGLVVFDHLMFYSDWYTSGVYMVDMVTGKQEPVVQHLSRPTSLVIYHPANLTASNQCQTAGAKCDEICVPVPRSYHCSCHLGSKLAADNHTCLKMANPWEVTDSARCNDLCDMNAYCAKLVPRLEFQCVCKAGYEGNGKSCGACGKNFYKPLLGNESCVPCPHGSTTDDSATASQCMCTDPSTRMINNICMAVEKVTTEIGSRTEVPQFESDTSPSYEDYLEPEQSSDADYDTTTHLDSENPKVTWEHETWETTISNEFEGEATKAYTDEGMPTESYGNVTKIIHKTPDIGYPYFVNCPQFKEVNLGPDANGRVELDLETAFDGYGNRLPLRSSFSINNDRISLEWAKGIQQTVILNALDNWKQTATCQFQVLLKDTIPPSFTSCPGDLVKKTEMVSETIFWPLPTAVDNSLTVKVIGSHKPNSHFEVGTTYVNYTAEDDSGNVAECRFSVTIVLEQRCSLPPIKNGVVVCKQESVQAEMCHIACQKSHIVNPVSIFSRAFDCRDGGEDYLKISSLLKKQEACLLKRSPTIAEQELSLSFEGPCRPEDEKLKEELRLHVIDKLKEKNHCEWAVCIHGIITIHCGPPPIKRRRGVPDTFDMRWNVTIQNSDGLSKDKVESIFLNMKLELMKMAASPISLFVKQHFQMVAGSVRTFPLVWSCLPGEMMYTDSCVPCPAGTYYNTSTVRCELCPRGFWQSEMNQLHCHQCGFGFTRDEGAISDKECVTFPPIDEMSKFLIITACTFGIVFLCMVIFMYLQYQRQQHQAKQRMALMANNSHRLMMPNIYASPPIVKPQPTDHIRRGSLDYIGCHDYEDIDGASTATKAMLQALSKSSNMNRNNSLTRSPYGSHRGSMNSFKGAGEGFFRIPPSPTQRESLGTNSFQTSAETLVQSSPRGSHRSFHVANNDGFYGKPPMSPGVNTINSFKGSPVSPYKSLNFGRENGVPCKLSPESPTRSPQLPRDLESPYRLTYKTHEADSPFRLARESPYGRVMVTPSPFYQELQKSFKSGASPLQESTSGHTAVPSTPDFFSNNRSPSNVAELQGTNSKLARATTDTQHSLKSVPDSSINRSPLLPPEESNNFVSLGDTLYKRPPSPVSPMPSSRISNDSLHRSPSTPRASPLTPRRRTDAAYRTPPQTRSKRSIIENSCYEYD